LKKLKDFGALKLVGLLLLGAENRRKLGKRRHKALTLRGLRTNGGERLFNQIKSHAHIDHRCFSLA
jgi:hypothetical protein